MKITDFLLKMTALISLAVYPLFYNLLGGASIAAGAINNYRSGIIGETAYYQYLFIGIIMLVSSVIITSATVLVFGKRYKSAFVTDTAGTLLCILAVVFIINAAAKNGLTDDSMKSYSVIYARRHLPTVIHLAAVYGMCIPEYIRKKNSEKEALHNFIYSNSGIDEIMNMPDDD